VYCRSHIARQQRIAMATGKWSTFVSMTQPCEVYAAPTVDDRRMWDLWLSGLHQPSIVAAEEAGLFAALDAAPATAGELAARLGFDERATTVLVRLSPRCDCSCPGTAATN
jgi:hypothetical protein